MSNFIKENLADKASKRGSNFEQLLDGFRKRTEMEARREEEREEKARKGEQEEHEQGRRGLPSGFAFRRHLNH